MLDAFAAFPRLDPFALAALPAAESELIDARDSWRTIDEHGIEVPHWAAANRGRLRAAAERVLDVVTGEHLQHSDGRADNVLIDADG
ncbi:hypothetical protein L2X99_01590 [Microbacterium sp. KUDC0406]|uniref:hypothetical protein n=1 Tax=Microbacterium sp. KUDC0406 TaxID=2909588 RepID=UPI001F42DFDB|nr:hypothetical protein [Microbacterium sp. KUDC0406]UJP10422.1 hypothetical protein L2X99_01590 [Microbacterium sp. KUDC0406]